jgi:putative endonuclease
LVTSRLTSRPLFDEITPPMSSSSEYYVYILASGYHGLLNVELTNDLRVRLEQHRARHGADFSGPDTASRLVYVEAFVSPQKAIARQRQLKSWPRDRMVQLIERDNPDWSDLSGVI